MPNVDKIKNLIFLFLKECTLKKNLDNLKEFLSEDIVYVGNKENEICSGKENVIENLEKRIDEFSKNLKIQYKEPVLNIINENTIVVCTELVVKNKNIHKLSFIFTLIGNNEYWEISMIHNPNGENIEVRDLEKLKEELAITRFSMDMAINQSGVYYYEYDKDNNTVDVNEGIQKLLGVSSHIENYPEIIFQNGLVVEEDIDIYKKNIKNIKTGKKKQVSFDVRFNMPDGGICWFRKYFISIYNSQGKIVKIIGVMSNINQLKNIEESISLEQNKKFNSEKALRFYYKINLTKGLVLEQKEKESNSNIIIKKCNIKYENFLQDKLGNIIDKESREYFKKEMNIKAFIAAYLENKEIEFEYRRRIGTEIFWVKLRIVFLLEPQSNDMLAFAYIYDISKEKESLLMLDAIMMNQNEYILRKELLSDKCYVYASKNNFMGFPRGLSNYEIKEYNKRLDNYIDKLKASKNKEYLKIINEHKTLDRDILNVKLCEFIDNYDKKTYKRIIYFVDRYCSLYMLVLDVSDVILSERKTKQELEEALKKAEEIAIGAKKSKLEADKANTIKTDFLARMSHDMRTPMSAIIGLTNFGLEESEDLRDRKYFEEIKDSSEYLLQLINDILDMQTLESGKIVLKSQVFKVETLVKKIETIIKSKAEKKGIILKIHIETKTKEDYLNLDEKRLAQILINILNNALKYTKAGKEVIWELYTKNGAENEMELINKITDQGVGMSKNFQRHIYEPFSKEYNDLSKNEGGTGLGLAITKNLVDNMDGEIYCQSTLGQGTAFKIVIPYTIEEKKEIYIEKNIFENKNMSKNFQGKKVLLCEDVDINAKIVTKILNSKGFEVIHFLNGSLGIEELKKNDYDIVLMDIRMPVMDGITAVKKIRKFNKEIPIIALSANAYTEDIEKSLKVGMNAHLSKPIDKNELFDVIGKLIK
ncbi:response regulator [Fusobacterium sp. MFO224]|uniref:response regulator n=1 Tax=Fusobacterium sp. MFO224 TaxID=3378070 RepID=UPI003854D5D9